MSQEYFPGDGRWGVGESSSSPSNSTKHPESPVTSHQTPYFITVGAGQPSASAAALTSLLNDDSGYGGSVSGGGAVSSVDGAWRPELNMDMPTFSQAQGGPSLDGMAVLSSSRTLN